MSHILSIPLPMYINCPNMALISNDLIEALITTSADTDLRAVSPSARVITTFKMDVYINIFPAYHMAVVNTLRPGQNRRHFADDHFKLIFLNENVLISIKISLKFVPQGLVTNISALVQIMALRRPGDKPLSGPMMVRLPTHICVTRLQLVKRLIQNGPGVQSVQMIASFDLTSNITRITVSLNTKPDNKSG